MSFRYVALFAVTVLAACPPDNIGPDVEQPTAPAPPSGLTALPMSPSQINLIWTDASSDEEGFVVERCVGVGCSSFGVVEQVPANSAAYFDINRAGGTSYSYRVRATKQSMFSSYSNTATAVTAAAATAPAAPTALLSAGITSSQVDLSWTDNSSNEDGFRIEQCQGASCTNFVAAAATNQATIRMTQLTASTSYRFRVLAYNGVGPSAPTTAVTITTLAAAPISPVPPTNLAATAVSSTQINLSWTDASANEDGFRIERCEGAGCVNYGLVATTAANATNYSNTGLTPSTTYRYRIQAVNTSGSSAPVGPATATTLTPVTVPAAPTSFTATAISSSQIYLSWTDASNNEEGFRIERCAGLGCTNYAFLANAAANATAFASSGLTASTTYRYRLQSYNATGSSTPAGPAEATTPALVTLPTAPTGLTASVVSSSQINLAWVDASSNETGFIVERCAGSACTSYADIGTLAANSTTFQSTGLAAATTYGFRVRSFNSAGAAPSSAISATTFVVLSAPALNTPTVSGTSVTLTWSFTWPGGLASSADRYALESSTTSATSGFALVAEYFTHTTPHTVTLTNRAIGTHYFRVRAVTTQGTSPNSVVRSATVAAASTPTTLRIINDLPGYVAGPNDWGKLNTVVRVRVGPTSQSVINFTSEARELLYPLDYTSNVANTLDIPPGSSMTLDVSSQPGPYWIYVQTGWWDYFAESGLYEKHMAIVVGCQGQDAYKWTTIQITAPFGNPEEIRLSSFLPQGNWYQSPFCP